MRGALWHFDLIFLFFDLFVLFFLLIYFCRARLINYLCNINIEVNILCDRCQD